MDCTLVCAVAIPSWCFIAQPYCSFRFAQLILNCASRDAPYLARLKGRPSQPLLLYFSLYVILLYSLSSLPLIVNSLLSK